MISCDLWKVEVVNPIHLRQYDRLQTIWETNDTGFNLARVLETV